MVNILDDAKKKKTGPVNILEDIGAMPPAQSTALDSEIPELKAAEPETAMKMIGDWAKEFVTPREKRIAESQVIYNEAQNMAKEKDIDLSEAISLVASSREYEIIGSAKTLGQALTRVPKQVGSKALSMHLGYEGASVTDSGWEHRILESASRDQDKFVNEVFKEYKKAKVLPGIEVTDIAELPENIAFSLTSMGAGLAAGLPLGVAPIPGARVAAWASGTAASGKAAFEMSTYEIGQAFLEVKNQEKLEKEGSPLTREEERQLKKDFAFSAQKYGLWEAVPEALSNLAFARILTKPLTKMVGGKVSKSVINKLAGVYGEELLTETITEKGQAPIAYEAGMSEEKEVSWKEAFKRVAPQTFLLSTIMAGAGATMVKAKQKIKQSLKTELGATEAAKYEKRFTGDLFEDAFGDQFKTEDASIPSAQDPLIEEAKGKSLEEFVEGQLTQEKISQIEELYKQYNETMEIGTVGDLIDEMRDIEVDEVQSAINAYDEMVLEDREEWGMRSDLPETAEENFVEAIENIIEQKNITPESQLRQIWEQANEGEGQAVQETQQKVKTYFKEKQKLHEEIDRLRQDRKKSRTMKRRQMVRLARNFFNLTDADIRKISNKDVRYMSNREYGDFLKEFEVKAVELAKKRDAKERLISLIHEKNFEKWQNYRRVAGYPPISQMTTEQLNEFHKALEQYQEGDVFLTQRELETVDNSELAGIKTYREAREKLASKLDVSLDELTNMAVSPLDKMRWDTALAEKNPFYAMMVETTNAKLLDAEAGFLETEQRANDLARKAFKSKKRSIVDRIIPQNKQIIEYLESPQENKASAAQQLTTDELNYAHFIEQQFQDALDYLIKNKSLQKGRENYFTHIRMGVLEAVKEEGIVKAFKNVFKHYQQDQMVFNILDDDTGNILPLNKFFQFSLRRTGEMNPSKNVTKSFLTYMRILKRKQALDDIIPTLDIYAQSLTPKARTPRGLEIDRRLKKFVKEWLNNKKGRRTSFGGLVKQGGKVDVSLRAINTFVSMLDLGFSIFPAVASTVGEQVMTFQGLGSKMYAKGMKRKVTKKGQRILKKYKNFTNKSIWEEIVEPDKPLSERFIQGLFGIFHESSVQANRIFLLGSMTKQEWANETITTDRLAKMKTEIGRWRAVEGASSITGSTSVGKTATKYKTWSIPIMRTTSSNVTNLARKIKNQGVEKALTSQEAQEIKRAIGTTMFIVAIGTSLIDEDDDSFLGKLKKRVYLEAMTFLNAIDPYSMVTTPRAWSFLQKLAQNIRKIILLEEYKTTTRWGEQGELKGVKGIERQLTPQAIKQFTRGSGKKSRGRGKFKF